MVRICRYIHLQQKQRRKRSRYLFSVMIEVVKNGKFTPTKAVHVCAKNNRKEYLCLISADVNLDKDEISAFMDTLPSRLKSKLQAAYIS